MTDIKQRVREYIVDSMLMGGGAEEIRDDTSFLDIGALDSTGVIELVSFLEKTFGITVADEEMVPENLDNLSAVERYVSGKLRSGSRRAN